MYTAREAFRYTNFYVEDVTVADLYQFQFPERSGYVSGPSSFDCSIGTWRS